MLRLKPLRKLLRTTLKSVTASPRRSINSCLNSLHSWRNINTRWQKWKKGTQGCWTYIWMKCLYGITETLKMTDPEFIQMDEFKNKQLLSLTINLLLFIRSQVPVTKKLFQSYAQQVILNPDSAHPKLLISPEGDSVTYTETWQEVPENPSRFDTTLNAISRQGFKDVRNYWEVQVADKTYWELGLTYPNIPRKGREEDCWMGRGPTSWCVEFFNGDYTAWHNGVPHELTNITGKTFQRIGIFSSSKGGLVCFLGADTMTPLYCFCAGTFTDPLYQAVCPGHDNQGTNWKPLLICDASRSAPVL
nr:zinc-binding protein A33 isoform X3 [Misgurnus anguillicaudatus]